MTALPIPLALGRFKQLPQRSAEVWQGIPARLPAWVDDPHDPAAPPYRPWIVFWVSLRTGLIHLGMSERRGEWTPEVALSSLLEFGAKWAKHLDGRPSRVEVADPRLRDAIAPALESIGTPVVLVEDVDAATTAFAHFEMQAMGTRHPTALDGKGVTIESLRDFAAAAAAFFTARPWAHLSNDDLIVVQSPKPPRGLAHVVVLGDGGEQFGLAFFESRRAFERLVSGHIPKRGVHGVTFGPIDSLPFADVDIWEDYNLPVAGRHAYPLASRMTRDGVMTRPNAAELAFTAALLRALAATTEAELDTGRWTKRVDTPDGAIDLTLTIPALLEAAAQPQASVGSSMARGFASSDHVHRRIQRFLNEREFGSIDDATAALSAALRSGHFDGDEDRSPEQELSIAEQAEDLAARARDATGRLRIKLAREALALSADCAAAWMVLGDSAGDADTAVAHCERAVDAAARTLGDDAFSTLAGAFWSHLETRPYMRSRLALAQALIDAGRSGEAVDHLKEMLRLNPHDNQGVRYLLLPLLLVLERDADASDLLAAYDGDVQATWPYGRALLAFRRVGDTAASRQALADAVAANPHVARFLIDPGAIPPHRPEHYTIGNEDEAIFVAGALEPAVAAIPGAAAWLARHGERRSQKQSGRRRPDAAQ